jgi:hypothetical protein
VPATSRRGTGPGAGSRGDGEPRTRDRGTTRLPLLVVMGHGRVPW